MSKRIKVIAVNGSPRKKWNTATLLEKALEGASSQGAKTELIHLYDLDYKGCMSCFSCKMKNGKSYGRCAVKDDLTSVFKEVLDARSLIFGSPIYLGTATGQMRSFMERLVFPFLPYIDPPSTIFPKKIKTGFIYTLGATEEMSKERGFNHHISFNETILERIFGYSESLCGYDSRVESWRSCQMVLSPAPPHQTGRSVFPNTAFQSSSSRGFRFHLAFQYSFHLSSRNIQS